MDLQTCQALTLWATHELTHMRVRRANALWSTVDVLLRQRVQAFQTRVEEEAAFNRMQQEGVDTFGKTAPIPMGWRDLVEQELTVNALWIIGKWRHEKVARPSRLRGQVLTVSSHICVT